MCKFDSGLLDVCRTNGRVLNVAVGDRRFLDLQLAHGPALQLANAHRIDCQFRTCDAAVGKLPGCDDVPGQRIGHGAQRHGDILPGQAIIAVLRHPHGDGHSDAPGNHPNRISQEDRLQEGVLFILFRLRHVDELHRQGDVRQIAPLVELILGCLPHFGVTLILALFLAALSLGDLLGFRDLQMNPFREGIVFYEGTVHKSLRQIQDVAILVLAGGHDARGDVCHIHVVLDARQVLALTDFDVRIVTHTLHDKHIEPVPHDFTAVVFDDTSIPKQAVHGILVLEGYLFSG